MLYIEHATSFSAEHCASFVDGCTSTRSSVWRFGRYLPSLSFNIWPVYYSGFDKPSQLLLSFIYEILESAYMQCEVVAEAERQALVDEETAKVCVETAEAAYMRAEEAAAAAQRLAEETRATADKLAKEATEAHKVASLAAAATAAAHQVLKGACEVSAVAKTYAQAEAARASRSQTELVNCYGK